MGVESYFINILLDGVTPIKTNGYNSFIGHSKIRTQELIQELQGKVDIKVVCEQKVIIDNSIEMLIGTDNGFVREITLRTSFSWYNDSIGEFYTVAKSIDDVFGDISIYHPTGLFFKLGSEAEFAQHINDIYRSKYQVYLKQFGDFHIKILPDNPFYEAYKKYSKKSLWSKLFKSKP